MAVRSTYRSSFTDPRAKSTAALARTQKTSAASTTPKTKEDFLEPEEEWDMIKQFLGIPLKEGDIWYLVNYKWYRAWTNYSQPQSTYRQQV